MTRTTFAVKRAWDTLAVSLLSTVALPVAGAVWVALSRYKRSRIEVCRREGQPLDYQSPLIVQMRVGKGGDEIGVYKFRTMRDGTAPAQERIIAGLGERLRRRHIDEIPQFLNVLKGNMAMDGGMRPKPIGEWLLAAGLEEEKLPETLKRFEHLPKKGKLITMINQLLTEGALEPEWAYKIKKIIQHTKPSLTGASQVAKGIDQTPGDVVATRETINHQVNLMYSPCPWRDTWRIYRSTFGKAAGGEGDNVVAVRSAAETKGPPSELRL